jgi:hypothetical protein
MLARGIPPRKHTTFCCDDLRVVVFYMLILSKANGKSGVGTRFKYEYAVVSPWDGVLDFMTADKMNTENMSQFLQQISEAQSDDFNRLC